MDIGNQQRVIIVEVSDTHIDDTPAEEPTAPAIAEVEELVDLEVAAWPLPFDLDPEPVN